MGPSAMGPEGDGVADAAPEPPAGFVGCDETIEKLYVYLDGELTEEKRSIITGHLDDCNPCLEAFDFEAELRIVVSRRCHDDVPESLKLKIAHQLELQDDQAHEA